MSCLSQNAKVLYFYNQMKERNTLKPSLQPHPKPQHHHKIYTLGVTPTYATHDTRSSIRKSDSQSKFTGQSSTITSPKNISVNSKKSQHSEKHAMDETQKGQKSSITESIRSTVIDGSLLQRKKRKNELLKYDRRQEEKMKCSVMKSLANVINVNDMHSAVNISVVADTTAATSKTDFVFLEIIGKGTFGNVWKVQNRKNLKFYALKQMSKALIIANKSVDNVLNEKRVLGKLNHPLISKMYGSFSDRDNLYMILELLSGGDLRYHMTEVRRFMEEEARFMIGCVVQGLEALHSKRIAHRDLKPENLVFDSRGYLKITDFGISKSDYTSDTSGTPGYMAPEVMCRLLHNHVSDYFALGVLTYQLMTGKRPYNGKSRNQIRQSILSKQIQIKKGERDYRWSTEAIDFINKLIQRQPNNRLGFSNGISEIKEHLWLKKFNWKKLMNRELTAPFLPKYNLHINPEMCYPNISTETLMRHRLLQRLSNHNQIFEEYYQQFNQKTPRRSDSP